MGALHDAVMAATSEAERKAIKAQAWIDRKLPAQWSTVYRSHTVVITDPMVLVDGNVRFTMHIYAPGGADITPPDANPYTIVNPPYLVEDENGDIELPWTDADGNPQVKHAREGVLERVVHQLQELADKVIDG